jgi:hypothetical protein
MADRKIINNIIILFYIIYVVLRLNTQVASASVTEACKDLVEMNITDNVLNINASEGSCVKINNIILDNFSSGFSVTEVCNATRSLRLPFYIQPGMEVRIEATIIWQEVVCNVTYVLHPSTSSLGEGRRATSSKVTSPYNESEIAIRENNGGYAETGVNSGLNSLLAGRPFRKSGVRAVSFPPLDSVKALVAASWTLAGVLGVCGLWRKRLKR